MIRDEGNSFSELLKYEYKKVLGKKVFYILFSLSIALTMFRYITYSTTRENLMSAIQNFFEMNDTTMLNIFFLISICIAPIFSEEYVTKVDQLILASKNGKSRLIFAKIIVGITSAIMIGVVLTSVAYIISGIICGFELASRHEVTLLITYSYCLLSGSILSVTITMFLSVIFKTPYITVILGVVFILVSRLLNFPDHLYILKGIANLLPIKMADAAIIFSEFSYNIVGLEIKVHMMIPIVAASISSLLIYGIYKCFKSRQIN